jgi:phosphatidylserine/phosphatidylglycerophosphate/cardiolipin synthase-like enzyme
MSTEVFFNRPMRPIPLDRLISDIAGAQEELMVACAWFTLDRIANAIVQSPAKSKGIVLNGADLARHGGVGWRAVQRLFDAEELVARATHWSDFMVAVLGSSDYSEGIMHHKFIVIDERLVWTGSYNLTYQAAKNYETLIRIEDEELAKAFSLEAFQLIWDEKALWTPGNDLEMPAGAFRCAGCHHLFPDRDGFEVEGHYPSVYCRRCVERV